MNRLRPIFTLLALMTFLATPAYSQGYGQYPNYSNQVPGLVAPDQMSYPAQQYGQMPPQYNQVQQGGMVPGLAIPQPQPQGGMPQPQYYQMISPTQVPAEVQQPNEQSLFQPEPDSPVSEKKAKKSKKSKVTPYQQQEEALQEAQLAQQVEELKQKRESEESFKMTSKFDDRQPDDGSGGFGTSGKKIGKGMASGVGKAMKTGMRYAAPAAGYVGSFFLLRAALGGSNAGNSVMMMPGGGGMYFVP